MKRLLLATLCVLFLCACSGSTGPQPVFLVQIQTLRSMNSSPGTTTYQVSGITTHAGVPAAGDLVITVSAGAAPSTVYSSGSWNFLWSYPDTAQHPTVSICPQATPTVGCNAASP